MLFYFNLITHNSRFFISSILLYRHSNPEPNRNSMSVQLYNAFDENGNTQIKFVEPCPKVQWAGSLLRDRRFVVNTESSEEVQKRIYEVTVFNPDFGSMNFKKKTSDRLEHVFLFYRRLGDGEKDWQPAQTELADGPMVGLDFAAEYASEDAYGFTTLDWAHGGKEGNFEIMVETQCTPLKGPTEFDSYRESILTGSIDVTRPQQYGKPLPLRNDILLGEEVSIIFTKPLDCGRPFVFEIVVDVLDTPGYRFDMDKLHVICEGRRIGFQINKGAVYDPALLMGKTFTVTIGADKSTSSAVKDVNGNKIEKNIEFSLTFANLNLSEASTSFAFTVKDANCMDATVSSLSETIKNDIALTLELSDTSRLEIVDLECHEIRNEVIALVNILPSSADNSNGARALRIDGGRAEDAHDSIQLFYNLRREVSKGRRLESSAITVGDMQILPSDRDLAKYKTHPDDQEREKELYHIGSLQHEDIGNTNDLMIREMVNGQISMKEEIVNGQRRMKEEMESFHRSDVVELEDMFMKLGVIMVVCAFVAGGVLVHLSR